MAPQKHYRCTLLLLKVMLSYVKLCASAVSQFILHIIDHSVSNPNDNLPLFHANTVTMVNLITSL